MRICRRAKFSDWSVRGVFTKFLATVAVCLAFLTATTYAAVGGKPKVAVVDFGLHGGAITSDFNVERVGAMCTDYIENALVDSGRFTVIGKDIFTEKLLAENLTGVGIIPPSMIRKVGTILGVDYVIIGSVFGVGGDQCVLEFASNGAKINSVKACIIARLVEVSTGNIVTMAEGRGESKSSLVKVGKDNLGFITIGTKKIPQVSVHNSVEKAAYSLVAEFLENL